MIQAMTVVASNATYAKSGVDPGDLAKRLLPNTWALVDATIESFQSSKVL